MELLGDPRLPQPPATFQACLLLGSVRPSTSDSQELLHSEDLIAPRLHAGGRKSPHLGAMTLLKQPLLAPFPWAESSPSQSGELSQTRGEAASGTKAYASLMTEGLPAPPSPTSPDLTSSGTKGELT